MNPQQVAERVVRHFLAQDTVAQALGVTVSHVAPGEVTAHLTVTDDWLNGHGSAHGSIVFTLADIAFGMARNSYGELAIGRSCSIEYLAPAFPGEGLSAHAAERALQGRTGIYDIAVHRDSDGTLLAELRAVSRKLTARPEQAPADVE